MTRSARCGWFSGWASTSWTVPTMPASSSATSSARSPAATSCGDPGPERARGRRGERGHEAGRCAAIDAVDQEVDQAVDLGLVDREESADGDVRRGAHVTSVPARPAVPMAGQWMSDEDRPKPGRVARAQPGRVGPAPFCNERDARIGRPCCCGKQRRPHPDRTARRHAHVAGAAHQDGGFDGFDQARTARPQSRRRALLPTRRPRPVHQRPDRRRSVVGSGPAPALVHAGPAWPGRPGRSAKGPSAR